jgi:hypothetical protein
MWAARVSSWVKKRTDDVSNHKFKIGRAIPPSQQNRHMIKREGGFEPIFRQVPNNAPALLIRMSIGGSRVAISAARPFHFGQASTIGERESGARRNDAWLGASRTDHQSDRKGRRSITAPIASPCKLAPMFEAGNRNL